MCPRKCNINRSKKLGFCSAPQSVKIARASRHMWEEPCISGTNGSGTVFFSGCNLKCVFCQNEKISRGKIGVELNENELQQLFLKISESGVNNINLVTPTHYIRNIIDAVKPIKSELNIPIIYNCSGYENAELIKECQGIIDIFLTDIKYKSEILSEKYSACPDYFDVAIRSLEEMLSVSGDIEIKNGLMKKGTIVRHLVLPGQKNDSIDILKELYNKFGNKAFLLSLMNQYTPMPSCKNFPEINRKLTTLEYQRVAEVFEKLGFDGYLQENSSSTDTYIPNFDDVGEFLTDFIK